ISLEGFLSSILLLMVIIVVAVIVTVIRVVVVIAIVGVVIVVAIIGVVVFVLIIAIVVVIGIVVVPMGIEQANEITWTELKRLRTNKYFPRTEIKKMEDEFYNLVVKGNDLKIYIRRFQELAVLCPNMVPNAKKLMEVFINGLPRSIEGNVTTSKPQTLEEAINIAQRLMDKIIKHDYVQEANNHKRKLEIRETSSTTTIRITITITTITMITTSSRTRSKKPSGLILLPMGILGIVPCVKGATCIT
ncbi:reverse transcriptase domain-containing protein, partial [Tanacetum coccineum]